ncbi:hypothetical protein GLOTRDRAFT_118079 [Gloeophyllum trabeum ATCC 11539]|uniref:DUF6534 domain-containing protein n=1 Tax=Gloeophyllum trabeum (strain ATCC 11539 / FP-39264 / Madison 617) TaxID=670483 RepID=S7PUG9_GLOTA|nr:uncharacterized protein GLOTRDRAFT_118079 [Gloeophyllum trabeum ATCC 11539]EPQ51003.1 hypothetical protein GLOTRDRAFT_118079 [Gloeophyllum trabeum ATCC 11539]
MQDHILLSSQPAGTTFGILFISLVVSAVCYGLTLLQTWIYFRRYSLDPWWTKTLVAVLWLLDTVHIILCTITIYWYLVTNYGNPSTLDDSRCIWKVQTDMAGLVGLIVQLFFARRVWKLSGNKIVVALIAILSTLHFTLGVVFTVGAFELKHFSKYGMLTWVTCLGFSSAAAADILIAAAMCYYLAERRTEFKRTNSVITTLMIYSINTGLLTSIIATACVIAFAISPTSFIWLSFFWVLGKCYVNSVMAMLNSRDYIREKSRQDVTVLELQAQEPSAATQSRLKSAGFRLQPVDLAVAVETITETKMDYCTSPTKVTREGQDRPSRSPASSERDSPM